MIVYRRDFEVVHRAVDVDRGRVTFSFGLAMHVLACGPHL